MNVTISSAVYNTSAEECFCAVTGGSTDVITYIPYIIYFVLLVLFGSSEALGLKNNAGSTLSQQPTSLFALLVQAIVNAINGVSVRVSPTHTPLIVTPVNTATFTEPKTTAAPTTTKPTTPAATGTTINITV